MKKAKALFAWVLIALVLVGCVPQRGNQPETTGKENASQTEAKDTLVVRSAKDIGDLNPHTMKSQMFAQDWVYESLVALKEGKVVPELAESWDISEDGKTYTFHLRDGVEFSDGTKFTSAIAKRNIEAVQRHADAYSFLQSLAVITSMDTPDDLTLVMHLSEPCNGLLNDFTYSRPLVMLGEKGFPASGDPYDQGATAPIGTGMWVLKDYVPDQYALFARNDHYWGEKPSFAFLKVVVIPDVNTAAQALKTGEIDVMVDATQITHDLYKEMEEAKFGVAVAPTTSVSNINLNTGAEILKDQTIRLALAEATDKEAVSKDIFGGLQKVADSYFAPEIPMTNTNEKPIAYNPSHAEELLEKAGWTKGADGIRTKDGKPLSLDLIYDSSVTNDRDIGLLLQSQYKKIGVQLNILPQESQVYRKNWAEGNFDLLIYSSWGGSYEPYATFAAMATEGDKFHTVQKGMEHKKELDEAMKDALSQQDEKLLEKDMQTVVKLFHDEVVYIPLTVTSTLAIYNPALTEPDLLSERGGLGVSQMQVK